MQSAQSSSAKLFTTVIVLRKGPQQWWENVGRRQWPEWGQKHISEKNWVPLGEGSAERPVEMKQVAQIMHVLLCQSVLLFCLGAENENKSYLHGKHWSQIVLFLSWVESVVVVQDNSDIPEKKLSSFPGRCGKSNYQWKLGQGGCWVVSAFPCPFLTDHFCLKTNGAAFSELPRGYVCFYCYCTFHHL